MSAGWDGLKCGTNKAEFLSSSRWSSVRKRIGLCVFRAPAAELRRCDTMHPARREKTLQARLAWSDSQDITSDEPGRRWTPADSWYLPYVTFAVFCSDAIESAA